MPIVAICILFGFLPMGMPRIHASSTLLSYIYPKYMSLSESFGQGSLNISKILQIFRAEGFGAAFGATGLYADPFGVQTSAPIATPVRPVPLFP